ncbi:MAG TPA: asparaginase [Candidatus Thalassarchaeaceae archaeon]|jgi:L-asparaginase II|nr:asparaginase [Candidatus Thalassarchaeaceae archaeon]
MNEKSRPSSVAPGRPGSGVYPSNPLGESHEGIPTGRDVEWEPLVDFRRLDVSENTIHGAIAWVHGKEVIHSFGGNVLVYGRSMMKPLLMKSFTDVLDDALTDKQKAIACSSHNGDTEHVATAQSILSESEWGLMQCPLDVPLVQFGRQVRRPRRWFHTCSGEHAAILRGLRLKGINRAGYTLPTSSWFQDYVDQLRDMLHPEWEPLRIAKDGCGLPTVSNTVNELATLFAALVNTKDDDWIWGSMCRNPDLIGGFNRLDSTIIKAGDGRVLAKEGADGLLGIAIEHDDWPEGLGIVIKIAHGWNSQATWYVARAVLGVLGIEFRNPYPLHRQKAFIVPGIVPDVYLEKLETVVTWDEWDPDRDRFQILENQDEGNASNPHGNEGRV